MRRPSLITVSSLSALSHRLSQTSSSCCNQSGTYREIQTERERERQVERKERQPKQDRDKERNNKCIILMVKNKEVGEVRKVKSRVF